MTTDQATQTLNPRVAEVFLDVVGSVADIIRTRRVTFQEFREAIGFLEEVAKEGELPLLMDVFLGVAVDDVNYTANGGTESNLEGPFYVPGAPILQPPYALPRRDDEPGETLLMLGTVAGLDGSPLAGATLDVWQANGAGEYSHFHPGVPDFNLRGRFTTDREGRFEVRTVVPAAYEIPKEGPTGRLLNALGRHFFRPAHLHVKLSHPSYRPLTTQIYFEGDAYLHSDVVGAVKDALVVTLQKDDARSNGGQAASDSPSCTCSYSFVLQPQA
jgi:catechol 1,2-dioxygenase